MRKVPAMSVAPAASVCTPASSTMYATPRPDDGGGHARSSKLAESSRVTHRRVCPLVVAAAGGANARSASERMVLGEPGGAGASVRMTTCDGTMGGGGVASTWEHAHGGGGRGVEACRTGS